MIAEAATILCIALGGYLGLRSVGLKNWLLMPLGFLVGLCLFVTIGWLQVLLLPNIFSPILSIALTLLVPVAYWGIKAGKDYRLVNINWLQLVFYMAGLLILMLVFRRANLVNWHTDTFFYMGATSLIADGQYSEFVTRATLTKRLLAIPLLHTPATIYDQFYLRAITPLMSLSLLIAMVGIYWQGLKSKAPSPKLLLYGSLGLLLLITNSRFLFHTFYINGHLFFGALVVLIAGSSWLLATKANVPTKALLAVQALAIPALVITRPEASMVVGLALLPILVSGAVSLRHKSILLYTLGVSMTIWQGFVASNYLGHGQNVPFSVYGLLLVGLALLLAIPLLRWRQLAKNSRYMLWATEAGLWLALALLAIRDFSVLRRSVSATFENVVLGAGGWGWSLVVMSILVIGLLLLTKAPAQVYLRFPVTTFIPLVLLLAYMRGGGYRVGDGDSLNRMWMQIIPLAVLYIMVAMASGQWRFGKKKVGKLTAEKAAA